MARPIEAPPVLRGKAALNFLKAFENPKPYTRPNLDLYEIRKNVLAIMEKEAVKKKGEEICTGA